MESRAVCMLLILVLLGLGLTCGLRQQQSQQQAEQMDQCYNGLFMTEESIKTQMKTAQEPYFRNLYKLTSYKEEVKHAENCGVRVDSAQRTITLAYCGAENYKSLVRKRSAGTCQPCCSTTEMEGNTVRLAFDVGPPTLKDDPLLVLCRVMSFSIPHTVTDLYTGIEHQAKHFTSSYQLLHLGHCVNEGAACWQGGTCEQATRIEWVLVTLPTGDKFVPTSTPSHCTCIYT